MGEVVIQQCQNPEQYSEALHSIINTLGEKKFKSIINGKTVLLKPNLCIDLVPNRAATTHPALIDALISIVKTYNPSRIIVGDGPGIGVNGDVFGKTGTRSVCEKHNVELINFNQDTGHKIIFSHGKKLKQAFITKYYFEADTIINLPVLKSHATLWVTGALKNMMGLMVNFEKHLVHFNGEAESISDLNQMLSQHLVIMDGMLGMMGNGPTGGIPANAKLLLGSWNPLSIDIVAAKIMGFNPKQIPMLNQKINDNDSVSEPEIKGLQLKEIKIQWKKPLVAQSRLISKFLMFLIDRFFKSAQNKSSAIIDYNKCSTCGRCQKMCPYNAIKINNSKILINSELCRLCLCCAEVCTNLAISMQGALPDSFSKMSKQ